MPRFSKKVARIATSEKIEIIRNSICKMGEKRITAIVNSLRKSDEVNRLLRLFSQLNNIFAEETDQLDEEKKTYNQQYATDINGKFGVEYNALQTIRRSIFGLYSLMSAFSPRIRTRMSSYEVDTTSIEFKVSHSGFGTSPVQLTYLTISEMPAVKQRLITEIEAFLTYLDTCMEECEKIIAEEKRLGNSLDELLNLLDKQLDDIYSCCNDKPSNIKNRPDFVDALINYKEDPSNVKRFFHQLNKKELRILAECIKEAESQKYNPKVIKAYNNEMDKVEFFYDVVSHIDDCVPEGKISAETFAFIGIYTGWTSSVSSLHESVVEIYKENGGTHEMPKRAAVNTALNKGVNEDSYSQFEISMNSALIC